MTDKKFTDEEIVKALEYCNAGRTDCDKCVLKRKCESYPFHSAVAEYAFDLINRQKMIAEEKQQLADEVHLLKDEVERLNKVYQANQQLINALNKSYFLVKTEAYKEFAERIRECCNSNDDLSADTCLSIATDIDCVLKEMVGDDNA